jgi:tetratricopeptide (TPR) repeat protein
MLDPRDVRTTVHAAWRSFFSALAGDGPVLAIVEDIHWAEPPLLDLLEDLADRVQGPAMFVCPSRPDLLGTRPAWGGGRRNTSSVSLDPLGVDDAERLIGHLLEIDDLPGSVRAAVLARAEGNPFFLEEIIRRLIDEGLVVLEQGRWRATAGITEVEIPDTVQAVLAARIDLLDAEDRRVLQAASVVGRVFWPGPVASLVGAARPSDLDERLRRLEERELVQSRLGSSLAGQPELIFKHILTRDVAYASIPRRERAAAHRTVGAWIERTAGDRVREFVELLAHHYGTAVTLQAETGEVDEAVRRSAFLALTQASIDARHKEVLAKAQRLADDALAIARGDPERADALEALGEAFLEDYHGDLAWRYLREAALTQLRIEPLDRVRIAYLVSRACDLPVRWPGSMREIPDADEVRSLFAAGMEQLPPGDSAERVMLMSNRAGWPFAFPDLQDPDELELAERSGLEAAAMAERLGRYDLASGALDQAQGAVASVGMYARAIRIHEQRAKVVPFLEDTFEIGDFYAMGAWSHYEAGRYREALRFCEEASAFAVGHYANAEVHSLSWRVVTRYRVGEWDGALEDHERLRSRLDDRRDEPPYFASHAFAVAATIMALRGETAASDELTEIVRRVVSGSAVRARAWFVRLLLERGDIEDARRAFDDRPPTWRVHRVDEEEVRMELLAAGGDWTSTEDVLAEVRAYAAESGVASLPWFADRHEGRAAAARGDLEVALERLASAADGFAAIEATWERARTDLDLARALASAGRSEDAAARASAAGSVFAALGAVKEAEAARRLDGRW